VTKERRAVSIGPTLSEGQAKACSKNGMTVYVKDCRYVKPADFGLFDAITCIGGLEHFCSVEKWQQGKQESVTHDFFQTLYDLLPPGGRFYMQTMTFSKNMIDFEKFDIKAKKGSAPHVMALMTKEFPGSWLPCGTEMVIRNAEPGFKLISQSSGRLDYIETIVQWKKKFRKFTFRKYVLYLSLIPKFIADPEFKHMVAVFNLSPNRICFEKEIMDHCRLVFEKV
jgi:cyclopropane-fatty-acyl-phospholipid synthase